MVINPRLPIVGVMGSGSRPHRDRASRLGSWLAGEGVHLLTGGGGGVMAAVSQAFFETPGRRGQVIGILPCVEGSDRPKAGYPNAWVEIPIFTHLPLSGAQGSEPMSRNHINILSSNVVVALPGGAGTSAEVRLALSYRRPIICYLESRDEIPELSPEASVTRRFADVQKLVRAQLQAARRGL